MPVIQLTQALALSPPKCPEGKSRIELCDAVVKGLYIEVRATSSDSGTFYLRYKNEKKTAHKKLGLTTEMTLAEARTIAKQYKAKLLQGYNPKEVHKQSTVTTFAEFFSSHYLPHVKQHNRSWKNDEQMFKTRLRDAFGDIPLDQIKKADAQRLHAQLMEEGLKPATCDHYLKLLRRVLNVAVDWEVLAANPLARVQLFNADNRLERYLGEAELDRLLNVLYNDENLMVCNILLFLLTTGSRLGEALNAKWCDIDTNRQWRIPQAQSKSKKQRYIPLNDVAMSVLEAVGTRTNFDYIFVNLGTGERYRCIKKTWTRLRKEAGLSNIRIHDLRHQYASMLVNEGRSLYEVQQLLGHSDPKVTERYAHLAPSTLQQAANSVSPRLGRPLGL
ncbi:MAG: integrase [Oleiphilaceae bacterium]|jgi:integrase